MKSKAKQIKGLLRDIIELRLNYKQSLKQNKLLIERNQLLLNELKFWRDAATNKKG